MSKKEHRLGVSEANLVVRHLKLESEGKQDMAMAIEKIDQLYGLNDISFDEKTHVLNLAYDASRLSIDGVENILKEHKVEISHDWWTQFKEGYYRYVDQNVKDNANYTPHSCNQPPHSQRKK